jgi:hypothetical protein
MFFEVIICTVNTGRVQRRSFDTWEEADRCADRWRTKTTRHRVEIVRRELPTVRTLSRPAAAGTAA